MSTKEQVVKELLSLADTLEKEASTESEVRHINKIAHALSALNGLNLLRVRPFSFKQAQASPLLSAMQTFSSDLNDWWWHWGLPVTVGESYERLKNKKSPLARALKSLKS